HDGAARRVSRPDGADRVRGLVELHHGAAVTRRRRRVPAGARASPRRGRARDTAAASGRDDADEHGRSGAAPGALASGRAALLARGSPVIALVIAAVVVLAGAPAAFAQTSDDLQTLRKSIEALQESQQRIEKELGEIKTMLRA